MRRTVYVTGGTIEGVEQDGIFIFKGIPFAAPAGDLRWESLLGSFEAEEKIDLAFPATRFYKWWKSKSNSMNLIRRSGAYPSPALDKPGLMISLCS